MENDNNNIDNNINTNNTQEENPETFNKLKSLIDDKQIEYKLLEVKI
jgi:hypothetical protein